MLLPKAGLLESQCEDSIGIRRDSQRFCVADGATESFDSRRWARLLTKHWASSKRLLTSEELLPWITALGERIEKYWTRKPLPWYAEEKAQDGAFAAFVGIQFFESEHGPNWQAVALGDSCLVHNRKGVILQSLPIGNVESFGFHPTLIPSKRAKQTSITDKFTIATGRALPGDVFLLVTDAIAAWYLRMGSQAPEQAEELGRLLETNNSIGAETMIASERDKRHLRNDDIAIVRILVCSDPLQPPAEMES